MFPGLGPVRQYLDISHQQDDSDVITTEESLDLLQIGGTGGGGDNLRLRSLHRLPQGLSLGSMEPGNAVLLRQLEPGATVLPLDLLVRIDQRQPQPLGH